MINTVIEGVSRAGVRAIVSKGWSELAGPQNSNIFYIGDCPHGWLFQHVAAVIHHGGAGTTACGLQNGRPTTIVPFFGECVALPSCALAFNADQVNLVNHSGVRWWPAPVQAPNPFQINPLPQTISRLRFSSVSRQKRPLRHRRSPLRCRPSLVWRPPWTRSIAIYH